MENIKEIENYDELRVAVALLNEQVLGMCNAPTTDEVIKAFMPTKDLLMAIFRYNVTRVDPTKNTSQQ